MASDSDVTEDNFTIPSFLGSRSVPKNPNIVLSCELSSLLHQLSFYRPSSIHSADRILLVINSRHHIPASTSCSYPIMWACGGRFLQSGRLNPDSDFDFHSLSAKSTGSVLSFLSLSCYSFCNLYYPVDQTTLSNSDSLGNFQLYDNLI